MKVQKITLFYFVLFRPSFGVSKNKITNKKEKESYVKKNKMIKSNVCVSNGNIFGHKQIKYKLYPDIIRSIIKTKLKVFKKILKNSAYSEHADDDPHVYAMIISKDTVY